MFSQKTLDLCLHKIRMEAVYNGAECQTVLPRWRHVGDINITVAITLCFAPLLQCSYFCCHLYLVSVQMR